MSATATLCTGQEATGITVPLSTAAKEVADSAGMFLWVDLDSPSRAEFAETVSELGLPEMDFDQLLRPRHRHDIERVDDAFVFVFKALERIRTADESELATRQVVLYVTDNLILTAHSGQRSLFEDVRHQLRVHPDCLELGPFAVAQIVCDEIVAEYDRIAHGIESNIIDVEHEVYDLHSPEPLDDIYALKREVLFFRRVEDPLHLVLTDLTRGRMGIERRMRERFQQTLLDLDRVDNTIDSLNELITSILQAHLAQVAVQQNVDMRRISSWAAIITVPTMIAGLYGMNFDFMPELHWSFGYPVVLGGMLVACFLVFRILKKNKWL